MGDMTHWYMWDMTHSYVWHDLSTCVTVACRIPWHALPHSYTWLICTCDMTHSYVWHDLSHISGPVTRMHSSINDERKMQKVCSKHNLKPAIHCSTMQHTAAQCSTLQHMVWHAAAFESIVRVCSKSCHTHEKYVLQTWKLHVAHMKESCHTYAWIISYICISHVTHMDEWYDTYVYAKDMTHMQLSHLCQCVSLTHTYALSLSFARACCLSQAHKHTYTHAHVPIYFAKGDTGWRKIIGCIIFYLSFCAKEPYN